MTEAMNIKTTKAKILMIVIVLATLVAVMAATAKPAEAATSCKSYAYAPYFKDNANGNRYIYFKSSIVCSAAINAAYIDSTAGALAKNGLWGWVTWNSGTSYSKATYTRTAIINCGSDRSKYVARQFRTLNNRPAVRALNGTESTLPSRFSSIVSIKCKPNLDIHT